MKGRSVKRLFIAAGILVCAAFAVSLVVGKYPLSPREIIIIVSRGGISDIKANVFWTLRLPRTVMAVLAGAGFGLAGSVYQIIFKNPLASPDIIGVAGGANLGAAFAIVLLGHGVAGMAAASFVGGIAAMVMVMTLVRATGQNSTAAYILAGIVIKAVSEALIMMLKFYADPERELAAMEFWAMGSLGGITLAKLRVIFPIFLLGFLGLVLLRRQITMLGLNEDESRMLGVRLQQVRAVVLGCSTLMVASVISMTGLISFVGLITPHIARLLIKKTDFSSCMLASLAGAFIMLTADCLARTIYSAEIPISILTTVIGVPFLVHFMRRRKADGV